MKDSRKSEIRVGITVIIGFVLLTWIFFWAKNISIFNDDQILKINFNSVAGLETGDAVTISGLKKGFVKSIELYKTNIIVTIRLEKEVELRKDAKFYIQMADLMGTKKIDISPGQDQQMFDYNSVPLGYFSGDIATAMAMFSSVEDDLVAVIKDFRITLDNLNKIIDDKELHSEVKKSFVNLNTLSNNLNQLIIENKTAVNELIKEGKLLTKEGREFINSNSEEVKRFISKSKEVFDNLNSLIINSDKFISETVDGKNNFGKFLTDETLMEDIKTSIRELRELMKIFTEQLKGEGLNVDAHIF